jgi:hypothetical protein
VRRSSRWPTRASPGHPPARCRWASTGSAASLGRREVVGQLPRPPAGPSPTSTSPGPSSGWACSRRCVPIAAMARVEPRTVHCSGGAAVVVRTALPEDAAAVRGLLRDVNATTDFIVTLPHERPPDDAAMAERLRRVEAHASHLALVAEAAGDIVGSLDFGTVKPCAHGASLVLQVSRSRFSGDTRSKGPGGIAPTVRRPREGRPGGGCRDRHGRRDANTGAGSPTERDAEGSPPTQLTGARKVRNVRGSGAGDLAK